MIGGSPRLIRGDEATAEVIDGSMSVRYDEAENRLRVQKAVLASLLAYAGNMEVRVHGSPQPADAGSEEPRRDPETGGKPVERGAGPDGSSVC
ncbi:MAG TPA: hypothetical protein VGG03_19710 [Thermoanaerobaculia bacterium]